MASGRKFGVDFGLLFVRIALAGIVITHGVAKLRDAQTGALDFKGGVEEFSMTLANHGFPQPHTMAIAIIVTSTVGGILVFLGLGWIGRVAAFAIAAVQVAMITLVHGENGFFLQYQATEPGPIQHGIEFNLALLALALCVVCAGPGRIGLLTGGLRGGGGGKKKGG